MADSAPKDFSTTPASNATVRGVNIAEGSQAAQLNDAIRSVLAVLANPDFGALSVKADTIDESTADAGVTIDGLLIKDGGFPGGILTTLFPDTDFSGLATTGDYKETGKATADTGWLPANGETMGSASSGATHDSDANENLFLHLWDTYSNTVCPVSGSRGASAAADWAANKTIGLPNRQNLMGVGAGDTYSVGETGGAATVTLTAAQSGLPSHRHTFRGNTTGGEPNNYPVLAGDGGGPSNTDTFTSNAIDNTGGTAASQAHENMPPYFAVYWYIKL